MAFEFYFLLRNVTAGCDISHFWQYQCLVKANELIASIFLSMLLVFIYQEDFFLSCLPVGVLVPCQLYLGTSAIDFHWIICILYCILYFIVEPMLGATSDAAFLTVSLLHRCHVVASLWLYLWFWIWIWYGFEPVTAYSYSTFILKCVWTNT